MGLECLKNIWTFPNHFLMVKNNAKVAQDLVNLRFFTQWFSLDFRHLKGGSLEGGGYDSLFRTKRMNGKSLKL